MPLPAPPCWSWPGPPSRSRSRWAATRPRRRPRRERVPRGLWPCPPERCRRLPPRRRCAPRLSTAHGMPGPGRRRTRCRRLGRRSRPRGLRRAGAHRWLGRRRRDGFPPARRQDGIFPGHQLCVAWSACAAGSVCPRPGADSAADRARHGDGPAGNGALSGQDGAGVHDGQMPLFAFEGREPQVSPVAWIAPTATLVGMCTCRPRRPCGTGPCCGPISGRSSCGVERTSRMDRFCTGAVTGVTWPGMAGYHHRDASGHRRASEGS